LTRRQAGDHIQATHSEEGQKGTFALLQKRNFTKVSASVERRGTFATNCRQEDGELNIGDFDLKR